MTRLEGKTAIVTGAGSGFGEGIAKQYAAEGAKVLVNDLNSQQGRRVADEIAAAGGTAIFHQADVSSGPDSDAMIEAAHRAWGRVDVLMANAGTTHMNKPMLDVTEEEFDKIYAVNVKAIYHHARKVVPLMRAQGGGVILITASTAGLRPRPGLTWYNGSKGAAILLAKSMAVELAPDRIRVNALCPVIGETALTGHFMGGDSPELRAKFVASIPLGRMSRPSDMAAAATFLASDEAEFLTGLAMEIDGGRCV